MPNTFDPSKPVQGVNTHGSATTHETLQEPHLTTPGAAVKVFRAEGEQGDKVALAAFSVSNLGVFASSEQGVGLFATGGELAAQFEGGVEVTGQLTCDGILHTKGDHIVDGDIQLAGADYAEDFDVIDAGAAAPGTVMVLDDSGGVRVSDRPYDRRVAGVVSGAGDYKPAIILDHSAARENRRPLALMGKVFCMVDASEAPISIGDLMTTSSTPGHAMKALDSTRAFGAVIGKALRALNDGCGLVPILVALQ
jgi:hypothetical protein